jgi:hypothetical protein
MARKANSEILAKYRQQLSYSQKWLENDNYPQLWTRLINLYRGKQYKGSLPQDRMLVNLAFATINVLYPSVSIGRPKIVVSPRTPEDADKAVVTEAIVNYWWEHYQCQDEYQLAVRDFLILGHGWVKSGYRYVTVDKEVTETADELADPTRTESAVESEFIIKEDRPFIERVDPFHMFVDSDASSMKDIRWIAQMSRRPLNDVKNDKRYDSAARQEVTASSYSKYIKNGEMSRGTNPSDAYCNVYEWYDLNTGTMSVFSETGDKFLIKPTKMPYAFGHPFTMLRNYDIPGYFYPMGELEAIEPLQYELNETRTQMMNHRKRYSRKYLFKESAFDDFGRQALSSDEDNAMVPVKGDENLGNVVVPMPALINPPDFYNQSAMIISDMDRVSGVSEYQRGILPEIRRTATEASIIQGSADARASEKLGLIEKGIAKCAERLIKLAQQYMTEEQTVRVLDKPGQWAWVEFDNEYINGNFDFTVEAGSTVPMNESFRRQMALQVVDAMAPFAQAGIIKLDALASYLLETGFGVKDPGKFMNPPEEQMGPEGEPMPPEGQPPMPEAGMPPQGQVPPEVIAQAQAQGIPIPPEVLAQSEGLPVQELPQGIPVGAGTIPGAEQIPPEVLASIPPELLAEIEAQGGFTPEVIQVLIDNGIL